MKRKTTVLERLAREEISRNIKYYMTLNKKITLQQLAELTGIPKSTLGNIHARLIHLLQKQLKKLLEL